MEETHLPDRLRRCERFSSYLEEFRDGIGATDYGATTVEVVEGLMRAAREAKESIVGVLDACSQFRIATMEENQRELDESYRLIANREEEVRKLITILNQGLDKVDEMLSSHGNVSIE
jgi:hypothetical protein